MPVSLEQHFDFVKKGGRSTSSKVVNKSNNFQLHCKETSV